MKNKKNILFQTMCGLLLSLCFFSFKLPPNTSIKEATDLSNHELIEIMSQGNPDVIIKWSAGNTFPLKLDFKSEFFSIDAPEDLPYSISVKKDIYVYAPNKENILLSLDGKTWKTFLEIATGNLGLSFGKDQDLKEHSVSINASLFERK